MALDVRDYDPNDHIHRFPSQLHSHSSFHPHSTAAHEPTDYNVMTNLPPGIEFGAMNVMPYEMINLPPR